MLSNYTTFAYLSNLPSLVTVAQKALFVRVYGVHRQVGWYSYQVLCIQALGLEDQVRKLGSSPKETHDLWFEWRFAETSHPRSGELITSIWGDGAGNGHVHR